MTVTPYFNSYELHRNIKPNSIWAHKSTGVKVKIVGIDGTYVTVELLNSKAIAYWLFTSSIMKNYTPVEI